jgi:prevent-host-death family protein
MHEVSIRELRDHTGDVLGRVEAGARLTVTRSGRPIAELVPLRRPGLAAATLLERWSRLPELDPAAVLDASL